MDILRKGRTIFCFLGLTCMLCVCTGCASVEKIIAQAQRMPETLPQEYAFDVSTDQLWETVREQISVDEEHKILTESSQDRFISFSEPVANWQDLGRDSVGPDPSTLGADPNFYKKFTDKPATGIAITSIWIKPGSSTGSTLQIRRVYQETESFANLGHSRGDYEQEFYETIKKVLEDNS